MSANLSTWSNDKSDIYYSKNIYIFLPQSFSFDYVQLKSKVFAFMKGLEISKTV